MCINCNLEELKIHGLIHFLLYGDGLAKEPKPEDIEIRFKSLSSDLFNELDRYIENFRKEFDLREMSEYERETFYSNVTNCTIKLFYLFFEMGLKSGAKLMLDFELKSYNMEVFSL